MSNKRPRIQTYKTVDAEISTSSGDFDSDDDVKDTDFALPNKKQKIVPLNSVETSKVLNARKRIQRLKEKFPRNKKNFDAYFETNSNLNSGHSADAEFQPSNHNSSCDNSISIDSPSNEVNLNEMKIESDENKLSNQPVLDASEHAHENMRLLEKLPEQVFDKYNDKLENLQTSMNLIKKQLARIESKISNSIKARKSMNYNHDAHDDYIIDVDAALMEIGLPVAANDEIEILEENLSDSDYREKMVSKLNYCYNY